MRKEGTLTYLHTDHLGSTSLATPATGGEVARQWYFPYGGQRPATGSLPTDYRFTGQRNEGTIGLYDYGARFYDPLLGRFVAADTVVPEPGNLQALNRFAYVLNNPLKYTDPSGRKYDPNGDDFGPGTEWWTSEQQQQYAYDYYHTVEAGETPMSWQKYVITNPESPWYGDNISYDLNLNPKNVWKLLKNTRKLILAGTAIRSGSEPVERTLAEVVHTGGRGSLRWGYLPTLALDVWEYSDFTVGPVTMRGPKGDVGVASTEFAAAVTVDMAFTAASATVAAGVSMTPAGPGGGISAGLLTSLVLGDFREGGVELVDSFYRELILLHNPEYTKYPIRYQYWSPY